MTNNQYYQVTIVKLYLLKTLLTCCAIQTEHWPEAKRFFKPIDIEYLSCECRKYYSYVNGTKKFEGKNVFKPGKSPMLPFEIPLLKDKSTNAAGGTVQSQVVVIAGAPCSGKSSLSSAFHAALIGWNILDKAPHWSDKFFWKDPQTLAQF